MVFKCLPDRITITPFRDYVKEADRGRTPYWWRTYNKVKHEFRDNFKKATLQTTKDALAAAFLIHVCHIPSVMRLCEYGILQGQLREGKRYQRVEGSVGISPHTVETCIRRDGTFPGFVETALFIFNGWEKANRDE